MKSAYKVSFLLITFVIFLTYANIATATMGGPSSVYNLSYNKDNNSVYYIRIFEESTFVMRTIDLQTRLDKVYKSHFEIQDMDSKDEYLRTISETFKNSEYLKEISLTTNNIDVDFEFLSEEKGEYGVGGVIWTDFRVIVKQDGKIRGTVVLRGCRKDQKFLTKGYLVPNSNHMILMTLGIGDCSEGGYLDENVYAVNGITYHDKTTFGYSSTVRLDSDPVYIDTTPEVVTQYGYSKLPNDTKIKLLYCFIILIIGFILGYILSKKYSSLQK